jgi:pimeloyl-ACP methyl ester carboxylesterase
VLTIKTANLATRSVRYLEAGEGETILLLHAFPLNAEQWLPQLSRVPAGWRMIAPDLRGLGPVEPEAAVAGEVTMTTHARDMFALMSHLDIRRAVVVGLSMGGYVAFAMLREDPSRVAGLVLADTRATADSDEARAGRDRMLALLDSEGPIGVGREMVAKLLGETTRREQPDLVEVVRHQIEASTPAGLRAAILALKTRADSSALLAGIECPTMVICGAEDTVTPASEVQEMSRAIRGARFLLIPEAGHLSNLESPLAFSEALAAFAKPRK